MEEAAGSRKDAPVVRGFQSGLINS